MVLAVVDDPGDGRPFSGHRAQPGQQPTDRPEGLEAAVRQQAVVAQTDPQTAADPDQHYGQERTFPGEEQRRGESPQMDRRDPEKRRPVDAPGPTAGTGLGTHRRFQRIAARGGYQGHIFKSAGAVFFHIACHAGLTFLSGNSAGSLRRLCFSITRCRIICYVMLKHNLRTCTTRRYVMLKQSRQVSRPSFCYHNNSSCPPPPSRRFTQLLQKPNAAETAP